MGVARQLVLWALVGAHAYCIAYAVLTLWAHMAGS